MDLQQQLSDYQTRFNDKIEKLEQELGASNKKAQLIAYRRGKELEEAGLLIQQKKRLAAQLLADKKKLDDEFNDRRRALDDHVVQLGTEAAKTDPSTAQIFADRDKLQQELNDIHKNAISDIFQILSSSKDGRTQDYADVPTTQTTRHNSETQHRDFEGRDVVFKKQLQSYDSVQNERHAPLTADGHSADPPSNVFHKITRQSTDHFQHASFKEPVLKITEAQFDSIRKTYAHFSLRDGVVFDRRCKHCHHNGKEKLKESEGYFMKGDQGLLTHMGLMHSDERVTRDNLHRHLILKAILYEDAILMSQAKAPRNDIVFKNTTIELPFEEFKKKVGSSQQHVSSGIPRPPPTNYFTLGASLSESGRRTFLERPDYPGILAGRASKATSGATHQPEPTDPKRSAHEASISDDDESSRKRARPTEEVRSTRSEPFGQETYAEPSVHDEYDHEDP